MESLGPSISTVFVYNAVCENVYELKTEKYVSGIKDEAIFTTANKGWYINIGGQFSIHVGTEKPDIAIGDTIRLTLQKAPQ